MEISIEIDKNLPGYCIHMPDIITLDALKKWIADFQAELQLNRFERSFCMLIDCNQHRFESIECMKVLREFLSECCTSTFANIRIAFVFPDDVMPAHIKSSREGSFHSIEDARTWLKSTH